MSALADAMSHAALGWVKPELDETLRQARAEIEAFAETPADTSRMRFCAGYLHQVQGTLRMVELYAPAMVAEELELLANAVQAGQAGDRDEACAMLMRGTVLLPDYLERLQNGHRDIPIVLLPLLNEIRAARGEPGLSESVLFAFDPAAGNATPAELEHARGSLRGRNRELLDTVGNAVKEELLRVKDALDLHLRTGGEAAELQVQVAELGAVADTLGMMGLGVARNVVVQQRDALRRIVDGQQAVDEGLLLDIAGALLYVDASLDDQVASLGADVGGDDEVSASANASEVRRTVEVLAHEAIANFAAAREHFVAFIETNWDHARLAEVPHLLDEVGGAMRILDLPQPADYLEGVRRYVRHELIDRQRIPSGRQLDTLADAMASLEYYLEALRERRPGREEILDITRNSLETLRYWPLPAIVDEPLPESVPAPAYASEAQAPAPAAVQAGYAAGAQAWTLDPVEWEQRPFDDVADEPAALPETSGSGFSFDPVAAEQERPDIDTGVPVQFAPVDLSVDGSQAPGHWNAGFAPQEGAVAFDPVSAEQAEDLPVEAGEVGYTFDSTVLDGASGHAPVEDAAQDPADELHWPETATVPPPAPVDGFAADEPYRVSEPEAGAVGSFVDAASEAPSSDALRVEEIELSSAAPHELDERPAAGADTVAGDVQPPVSGEDSPFVEPAAAEEAPAIEEDGSHSGVHEAVVGTIELDEASRAFLAELDAAAAGFTLDPLAEEAPAASAQPAVVAIHGGFEDDGNEIDSDIREVFLEEFDEELANLAQLLPVWRAAPGSFENLRPIRRVFHTLKGSGRLVGARTLGEFSWKIEGMLNRVLDGSRAASPAVVAMVGQAHEVLPQLNAALRQGTPIHADLPAMQAVADRIGAGEETFYVPAQPDAVPAALADVADEGTPASVDSVLREILEAEVATHLETVHAWLLASQDEPQPATEPLLRAVHTMSGAFAMTDVPEITTVTTPAESYVKRALAAGVTPSREGAEGIAATAAAISATIAALQAESPRVPSFAALATRLRGLADSLPEAQWPLQHFDEEADLETAQAATPEPGRELTGVEDLSAYLDEAALSSAADAAAPSPADSLAAGSFAPVPEVAHGHAEPEAFETTGASFETTPAGEAPASDGDAAEADVEASGRAASGDVEDITLETLELAEPADTDAIIEPGAASATGELSLDADGHVRFDEEAGAVGESAAFETGALDDAQAGQPAEAEAAVEEGAFEQAASEDVEDITLETLELAEPADTDAIIEPDTASATGELSLDADGHVRFDEEAVAAEEATAFETGAPDDAQAGQPAEAELAVEEGAFEQATSGDVEDITLETLELAEPADTDAVIEPDAALATGELSLDADGGVRFDEEAGIAEEAVAFETGAPDDAQAGQPAEAKLAVEEGAFEQATSGDVEDITLETLELAEPADTDAVIEPDAASATGELSLDADGQVRFDEDAGISEATIAFAHDAQAGPLATDADGDGTPAGDAQPEAAAEDAPAFAGQDELQELAEVVEEAAAASGYEDVSDLDAHAAVETSSAEAVEPVAEESVAGVPAPVAEADPGDLGPLDFQELDSELVDIFVEEGKDLLDHCDGLLASLRETPDERELLIGLQRDLHTLKGGARMAGINAIGDLGHGIESLLEAVAARRTELARDDVGLLERGFDRLHRLLVLTGEHRAVAMPADLIEAFDARTHGRGEAAAEAPAASATARPKPAAELVAPAPLSAPVPIEPQVDEELLPRVQQEQVRVRADLLDSLVNHAGEVAIYRSRLEQQLGAFRGAMGELDRTNIRLRDQLRRLDLETEAQIVARYQREQAHGERDFDPLELDRFSTLQQLSRALNESAADLAGLQGVLDDLARQYDGLLQQQSRVSSELQDGLMRARMVPFDGLVPRLRRVVRQAAGETGKQVQLVLEGTHGELDRNVLDRMVAPLEHMLRNSVAHGLEAPEARRAAGKPEEGTITFRLRREGSEIVLEVADDGAGLDREAIRRRGEQRGLIAPGEVLGDGELDDLIFASGFSTSEQVSQLAGRGVGMDVVRNEVRQLGGSVDIHSVRGQGVTFTLRLPQTLAVTQAVFVRIGETTFAVPVASVSGIGRIARARYAAGEGGYHYAGEEYALYDLGSLVGQAAATADGAAQVPLLLVRAGDLRAAVAIDQVLGNREIVVKPVGLQIASVPGIYGATITGDGRVVVILDVAPLVRRHLTQPARPVAEAPAESQRIAPLVMVVDDSLTMRKVTGRVLERHNLEVVAARDGVEALEKLEERVPDLMLLDIEMPRMDGYELATAMRADERFKAVPIVMITSRSGEKHRQRAFEIGVQRYLGKPYQELDLMRNVYDLLGIARVRE